MFLGKFSPKETISHKKFPLREIKGICFVSVEKTKEKKVGDEGREERGGVSCHSDDLSVKQNWAIVLVVDIIILVYRFVL